MEDKKIKKSMLVVAALLVVIISIAVVKKCQYKAKIYRVTEYHTGCLSMCEFKTLRDLRWYKNLERLELNIEDDYDIFGFMKGDLLFEEENEELMEYLDQIVENCKKLDELCVSNRLGNMSVWDWSFLEKGEALNYLFFQDTTFDDFSFVSQMDSLNQISLDNCEGVDYTEISKSKTLEMLELVSMDVKEAAELQELTNVKVLWLQDCPICENETEMEALREILPDAEIKVIDEETDDLEVRVNEIKKHR